jgi:hypothetical protein
MRANAQRSCRKQLHRRANRAGSCRSGPVARRACAPPALARHPGGDPKRQGRHAARDRGQGDAKSEQAGSGPEAPNTPQVRLWCRRWLEVCRSGQVTGSDLQSADLEDSKAAWVALQHVLSALGPVQMPPEFRPSDRRSARAGDVMTVTLILTWSEASDPANVCWYPKTRPAEGDGTGPDEMVRPLLDWLEKK